MGDSADGAVFGRVGSHGPEHFHQSTEEGVRATLPSSSISMSIGTGSNHREERLSPETARASPKASPFLGEGDILDSLQRPDDAANQAATGRRTDASGEPAASTSSSNISTTSHASADKDRGAMARSPNTLTSASHPATACSSRTTADDGDATAKGKCREWQQDFAAATASRPLSSAPSASSSERAPVTIAFLDKVAAPFAPRSQTISPYGSAHPLYRVAKKYRLAINQQHPSSTPGTPPPPSAPAPPSSRSFSPTVPRSPPTRSRDHSPKSPAGPGKAVFQREFEKEDEYNTTQDSSQVLSASRSTASSLDPNSPSSQHTQITPDMGSTRVGPARRHRRPSPLDVPASKRRRSNASGAPLHVVKVEETDLDTTFVITSSEPALASGSSDSRAESSLSVDPASALQHSTRPSPSSSIRTYRADASRAASPTASIDLRSNIAEEDCECLLKELRTPKLRIPRELPRPAIVRRMEYTDLQLDPSLKDVPLPYILDNIALKGSALLLAVIESSIAVPSTSSPSSATSASAIPRSVALRTPTQLLQEAAQPEYVLAVTSDESNQVMFLPVHGLVLATCSKSFAGIAQPPQLDVEAIEEGEDTIRILPVVHIHLPSSVAFSRLIPFFYTQESGSLLASLLPVQHLPSMSLATAQNNPSVLASHLAKLDQDILAQHVLLNHSVWKTSVALGAAGDELWKVLQASWAALVTALSIQHSESLIQNKEQNTSLHTS